MKFVVLLPLFAALLVAGCGEKSLSDSAIKKALKEAVEKESLQVRKHLYYRVNESEPYSGWVKEKYDSGQANTLMLFKDGKRDGPIVTWHENGQKKYEGTSKDGIGIGPATWWHENGQTCREATFKEGKPDGPWTMWHENGQKQVEATYKNGKLDGLTTAWHENGQKSEEKTYKDGELVSEKFWNSKGEEVETIEETRK